MPTNTQPKQLTSAQMLKAMSAKLGRALGVGASANFAVLKAEQSPSDLVLEYAIEEIARLDKLAKTGKAGGEVQRATQALKRIVDIALAADERLAKKNELGTLQRFQHPDQQKTREVSARGAGPLAKDGETTEAKDGLDTALDGLAEMAGLPPEEEEEEEVAETSPETEETVDPDIAEAVAEDGGADVVDAGGEEVQKSYPVGEDGVPIDGPVSWAPDMAKDAAKSRKATSNAAILEKAIKEGNVELVNQFRAKAQRPESGSLRRNE